MVEKSFVFINKTFTIYIDECTYLVSCAASCIIFSRGYSSLSYDLAVSSRFLRGFDLYY